MDRHPLEQKVMAELKKEIRLELSRPFTSFDDCDETDIGVSYWDNAESVVYCWKEIRSNSDLYKYLDSDGRIRDFAKDQATNFVWAIQARRRMINFK